MGKGRRIRNRWENDENKKPAFLLKSETWIL